MLLASLFVPWGSFDAPLHFSGDILLVIYLFGLARFFLIAAAFDTGSSFEGMGASREAFFSCLTEVAFFMNLITLTLLSKSFSLSRMMRSDLFLSWQPWSPALLLVAASFFIVLLAENCRVPVDDPETHLELTMIHEVMILDHSGVDLAYMLYGASIKLFVFAGILISLAMPLRGEYLMADIVIFFSALLGVGVLVGIVESTLARLRLNRVSNLLMIAFALASFGFVVALWRA
jgi:formate hydrogenlyase subunit 4